MFDLHTYNLLTEQGQLLFCLKKCVPFEKLLPFVSKIKSGVKTFVSRNY